MTSVRTGGALINQCMPHNDRMTAGLSSHSYASGKRATRTRRSIEVDRVQSIYSRIASHSHSA